MVYASVAIKMTCYMRTE